jgi:hypothetical protein
MTFQFAHDGESKMTRSNRTARIVSAAALIAAAVTPPLLAPLSPAYAQAYSPMPPACAAASSAAQAEGSRYSQPPSGTSVVVQMQHILFLTGLLLDGLDQSCRDWADYARTRQQFQTTYDSTMKTCLQVASNSADCRRKAYGS